MKKLFFIIISKIIQKKSIFFLLTFSIVAVTSHAQVFYGQLINKDNGQAIPYANIGIIGKNIGTVSDISGIFRIELNSIYDRDTLCISCIGYEQKTFLIADLKNDLKTIEQNTIRLSPKTYQLDEITIKPLNAKTCILGNYCDPNSTYGNAFYSENLGTEIGVLMKPPRKRNKVYLKSFRFYVGEFTFNKFPVRLNIYNLKNGLPYENILKDPIFLEITSKGEYMIDLKKYNIIVNGDFFVSLEYYKIPDSSQGKLLFCAVHHRKMNNGKSYYRLSSHGKWMTESYDNIGFSIEASCEE